MTRFILMASSIHIYRCTAFFVGQIYRLSTRSSYINFESNNQSFAFEGVCVNVYDSLYKHYTSREIRTCFITILCNSICHANDYGYFSHSQKWGKNRISAYHDYHWSFYQCNHPLLMAIIVHVSRSHAENARHIECSISRSLSGHVFLLLFWIVRVRFSSINFCSLPQNVFK